MKAHLVHGPWLPACLNCEEEIPLKRLKAMPHARRCRDCQELIDDGPTISASAIAEGAEGDEANRFRNESRYQASYRSTTRRRFPQEAA